LSISGINEIEMKFRICGSMGLLFEGSAFVWTLKDRINGKKIARKDEMEMNLGYPIAGNAQFSSAPKVRDAFSNNSLSRSVRSLSPILILSRSQFNLGCLFTSNSKDSIAGSQTPPNSS
jgi:hypothetical protein